jgi:pimeloyl-ACP methyl ester carboxylesterase
MNELFSRVITLTELPGVGHCPMDEAPELVNPLLMEFVEDYGRQGAVAR